jgi:hypothetical protein
MLLLPTPLGFGENSQRRAFDKVGNPSVGRGMFAETIPRIYAEPLGSGLALPHFANHDRYDLLERSVV